MSQLASPFDPFLDHYLLDGRTAAEREIFPDPAPPALEIAARAHAHQFRKDTAKTPYIDHPRKVAHILLVMGVCAPALRAAAYLHDVLEDTETPAHLIEDACGPSVLRAVRLLTDPPEIDGLPNRKELQTLRLLSAPIGVKLIKLADGAANAMDIRHAPPAGWAIDRRLAKLDVILGSAVDLAATLPDLSAARVAVEVIRSQMLGVTQLSLER